MVPDGRKTRGMKSPGPVHSAAAARERLLHDQTTRPLVDQRARLTILAERLNRAARGAMTDHLFERVRTDRRFAPVLRRLVQMTLEG